MFTKFGGKVAHGPWKKGKKGKGSSLDIATLTILNSGALQPRKKPLDLGCNADCVTLGLALG